MLFNQNIWNFRYPATFNHIVWTGQSLAFTGYGGNLTTVPNSLGLMFNGGFYGVGGPDINEAQVYGHTSDLVPLRAFMPDEPGAQTPHESAGFGFASHLDDLISNYPLIQSNHSVGSSAYSVLAKGTNPYDRGLHHVRRAHQLLGVKLHKVRAVCIVHGESDNNNSNYDTDIRQWQVDFETDYKLITGQSENIPCFHSQQSNWTSVNASATSVSAMKMLDEHVANPDKSILVCPKYIFPFHTDGTHLTNQGSRWLGAYYAKAYFKHVIQGVQWEPLRPSNVQRTDNLITVTFTGNVGNLVLDTTNVTDPGNSGFEYTDDTTSATIASVTITGSNTVEIALDATPTGANKRIRYAYTGTPGNDGGPTTGARGNLRDSDSSEDRFGNSLFNWCVHFDEAAA